MEPTDTFGQQVDLARRARGWTQVELARRAGLHYPYLNDVIHGRRVRVSAATIRRLAFALEVSTDQLLDMTTYRYNLLHRTEDPHVETP